MIGVDVDDLLDIEREEHVEEENLVAPDDALLIGFVVQPARPLVLHELVVESVRLGIVRQEFLFQQQKKRFANFNHFKSSC